jgi:serine/threonine protein kinase/Flp pilus assembly protein TadD
LNKAQTLVERLASDMIDRWRKGECPLTEEYLDLYPELQNQPEAAIELIYEEICLRQEQGHEVAFPDLVTRFPQWQGQLQVLFDCHQLLEARLRVPHFPKPGESCADLRLLAELGKGAQGHVFLATQPSLADRPIVLKLIPLDGHEHQSLARLQHTNIVPLYTVQDDPARNLRALCMPYFGGATLARVLELLRDRPPRERKGRDLLDAIRQAQAAVPVALPVRGPVCQFLAQASYVQAICWIGACLADALHYAHERGLVHLDVKPSNVLVAADGQAMLLDFHLAREPIQPDGPAPEWLGGTPLYMSPEQQQAVAAVRTGQKVSVAVDGRADIYSLGLVLCEALGAPLPASTDKHEARYHNPHVSIGLADIIARCVTQEPAARYPDAALVAADLRRHLADLPLQGVSNRSVAERWRKWRRRRPHALTLFCLLGVILATGAGGLTYMKRQREKSKEALQEGTELLEQHKYDEAAGVLKRSLAIAEDIPFSRYLITEAKRQLRLVERAQAAQQLHKLTNVIRFRCGVEHVSAATSRALEAQCREFWEKRDLIIRSVSSASNSELADQARGDLTDLAILWTDLHVRLASSAEIDAARREGLKRLAEVEELFGPSRILCLERRSLAVPLGLTDVALSAERQASELEPRTAWAHYAFGRFLLRSGKLTEADKEFGKAVHLQPDNLWPHFYKGKSAYQRGQYQDAVAAFTACVALAPKAAWCYYNRGVTYAQLGRPEQALLDYDQALDLDSTLAEAALNRGILHYQAKRYSAARNDLQHALRHGADPAAVYFNLALLDAAQDKIADALESLRKALEQNPQHSEARQLWNRLKAKR